MNQQILQNNTNKIILSLWTQQSRAILFLCLILASDSDLIRRLVVMLLAHIQSSNYVNSIGYGRTDSKYDKQDVFIQMFYKQSKMICGGYVFGGWG